MHGRERIKSLACYLPGSTADTAAATALNAAEMPIDPGKLMIRQNALNRFIAIFQAFKRVGRDKDVRTLTGLQL